MRGKLRKFEEKVRNAENAVLIDSLIEHAQKVIDDMDYYETVEIVRSEVLKRLDSSKYDTVTEEKEEE